MKSDERELLRAIRAGNAGPVNSLSPARHQSLLKRFERNGLTRDGVITERGNRALSRQSSEEVDKPPARPEPERPVDLEEDSEERLSDVSDIQGQDGGKLDDFA